MDNLETISNLLVRDGVSQVQRNNAAPAINDETVKLDKRSTADIIDFIYRYSKYVLYYDDQANEDALLPSGDWQVFFTGNLPFSYAAFNKFPVERLQQSYQEIRTRPFHQIEELGLLINKVLAVAFQLDRWHQSLKRTDDQSALYRMLDGVIKSDLNKALYRLIGIANTLPGQAYNIDTLIKNEAWKLTLEKLAASDKVLERYSAYPRRKKVAVLEALDEVFLLFYKGIRQVQQFAGDHFEELLSGGQQHAAHLGLLYCFLKLFARVQEGMNGMAGKHLNFFYKEILQLKQKEFVPDHVHVIIELAKQTSSFLLKKDTQLNAGKANNKDLDFFLEDDIIVNKASVTSRRTLFKDTTGNIYVAPVANSADGTGEPFRDPLQNSWPLLGAKEFDDKNNPAAAGVNKKHHPFGNTGLIIASPVLLLQEGDREIQLHITFDKELNKLKGEFEAAKTTPRYIINETNLKLLEKAGLAKKFISLVPVKREAGWSVLVNEAAFSNHLTEEAERSRAKKILAASILELAFTTDKGWTPAEEAEFSIDAEILTIVLKLWPDAPAIISPDPKILKVEYPVKTPLIRVSFNHQLRNYLDDISTSYYDELSNSVIQDFTIDVIVRNAKQLILANDEGPVDSKKTFFPFTSLPKIGSGFFVGSDEAFRKKLTSFLLTVTWDGLPDDLHAYYQPYQIPDDLNQAGAKFERLLNGLWTDPQDPVKLFNLVSARLDKTTRFDIVKILNGQPWIDQDLPITAYNNSSVNGFFRLRLNQHFNHLQYPSILAKKLLGVKDEMNLLMSNPEPSPGMRQKSASLKSITVTADNLADALVRLGQPSVSQSHLVTMATETEKTRSAADSLDADVQKLANFVLPDKPGPVNIPLPPYAPAIKEISFDYSATATLANTVLIHIYPFEEDNYKLLQANDQANFLPVFNDEGTLYIALEEALPGSNVNLLFQLAEFTANPDITAADVTWQYLSGNEWKSLEPVKHILSDTTIGFQVSGIVTLALPWDANTEHTILPSGKFWLKASAKKNTDAVCEGISITAQGVKAVFSNQENDLSRLALPLAPGSITGLREPKSEVKKISQDFPSFGGREPETEKQFYVRVSERLRHKGRAISVYDYEHLVLEAFPAVYKVKCIPHTKMCLATPEGELLSSPGWVTLAVIPEINNFPATSRFQPKVSRILLKEIQDYIKLKTSAFVNLQVVNPRYQKVDFSGSIFFKKGRDKNFYTDKLRQDVRNFLSPWILTGSQDIIFGGTLMMSSVLSFIEKQEYVEYVTDFKMLDAGNVSVKGITALMPWSIFIAGNQKDYEVANDDG